MKRRSCLNTGKHWGGDKMVAFAIGFPGVKGAQNIKHYKANKIYYQQFMQDESEDIEDNETIQ